MAEIRKRPLRLMANIITKIFTRIKMWFGYYNGPLNVLTGREFDQGPGFDINIEAFQIRRLGIKVVKDIKIKIDPLWLDNLKKRLEEDKK